MTPIAPVAHTTMTKFRFSTILKKQRDACRSRLPGWTDTEIFISSGSSITERCAALIVQDFANVGVNVEIEQMDFATLMSRMLDGEHDLGIIGSGGTLDPSEP